MKRFFPIIVVTVLLFTSSVWAESAAIRKILTELSNVKGPYTFAVLGDNRSGDRVYKKVIYQMMLRKPLFVLNTGDIIPNPGNREEWKNFFEISKPVNVPYFLAPGNHDIDNEKSQTIWRDEVDLPGNETYYSFTAGKDLFVALNSCEPGNDRKIEGRQLAWLARTLDPKKYRHQFVYVHHPLFLWSGTHNTNRSLDRYPEKRDRLHRLFVDKKVTAVFEGHEHTYRKLERDGINYIITGGGGAPLYGKESFNNFLVLKVDGDRIEIKCIDRDGMMRDEFVIKG